ncbi:MAG: penicillin-binding protein 2 [bacterium]|nr:penicillin-binding protein 2 [bacterium]
MPPSLFTRLNFETPDSYRRRVRIFTTLVAVVLLAFFLRLWYLQAIQGEQFRKLSESNRISYRLVRSPRGRVFDRNGKMLADSRPSFNIYLIKEDLKDRERTLRHLAGLAGIPYDELLEKVLLASPVRPFLIKADVDRKTVANLEENRPDLPGVYLQIAPLRHYRFDSHAGHILGYLGEVSESQLKRLKKKNYRQGDFIGKYGIENSQESFLRGTSGFKQIEVDAYGRELTVVRPFKERAGYNVALTLDYVLQAKAEALFEKYEGSIVALDPETGAILAMVSNPPINPNMFAAGIRPEVWREMKNDPLKPLENRATRGQYPPGSIFKIVMAFATLNEKIMGPHETVNCRGIFPFGKRVFRDWKAGGHGPVDLVQSLAQSCDVYYYTVGNKLGIERIAEYSHMFGFGQSTRFDGTLEKGGLVASDAWKRKRFKEKWYPGETISVSIGQGFNLVTPIQAANLIATVANKGTLWQPYIIARVFSDDGKTIAAYAPRAIRQIPIPKEIFELVRKGLWEVVNGVRGTAKKAAIAGIGVAGKTGTAQTVRLDITGRKRKPETLPRKFRDHGWFVAFAPFDKPRIAIAILGENAGRPGSFFAPIARELIKTYLRLDGEKKKPQLQAQKPSGAATAARSREERRP